MKNIIIDPRIPAGNARTISISGHSVTLENEQRDSGSPWFYWCFACTFPEAGEYEFKFTSENRVGTRGAAFSRDGGVTWSWTGENSRTGTDSFIFKAGKEDEKIIFCQGMRYIRRDFDRFLKEFEASPYLKCSELCKSRKGRSVPLVSVSPDSPEYKILLTSRHHAGEMMATRALEGILRRILADDAFGKDFRSRISVLAVPFVDTDGVEDGDQGKGRLPHDHARDYSDAGIYPETTAIKRLLDMERPCFVLDMHCPWIFGMPYNENAYMVGVADEKVNAEMDAFGRILEEESPENAPYRLSCNIPFGTAWNTGNNYTQGLPLKMYASALPFVKFSQTLEIPFANFGGITVDDRAMKDFGAAIARSIYRYFTCR